ncbi:hypothetical protein BH10ACT11_BH10ACT11_02710 [soil metagenome]
MKSSDRAVLIGVGVAVVVGIFYFMVLAPKRAQVSDLSTQITSLQAQVATSEQEGTTAAQAKKDFPHNYRKLVAIGKAVPADADTPSLLTDLQTLSNQSKVNFRSITSGGSSSAEATAPVAPTASTDPAVASESAAALLPLGATVGAAGLPVMPYEMEFNGGFFQVADFFGRLDSTVYTDKAKKLRVNGRLLTIDAFNLAAAPTGFPDLTASVSVTSYLAPKEGITAGATPTGPDVSAETAPATTDPSTAPAPATAATVGAN